METHKSIASYEEEMAKLEDSCPCGSGLSYFTFEREKHFEDCAPLFVE